MKTIQLVDNTPGGKKRKRVRRKSQVIGSWSTGIKRGKKVAISREGGGRKDEGEWGEGE